MILFVNIYVENQALDSPWSDVEYAYFNLERALDGVRIKPSLMHLGWQLHRGICSRAKGKTGTEGNVRWRRFLLCIDFTENFNLLLTDPEGAIVVWVDHKQVVQLRMVFDL